jgi:hypothetical protein
MVESGGADIQATIKTRFSLHRRKAASSPTETLVPKAASGKQGSNQTFAPRDAKVC